MSRSAMALLLAGAICVLPFRAHAQSIDYSAYEQLFGEPVTASATGKPQRVSEAPVNMEVVTADQIARSGARTLPDALRFVTGIDVRQYGMQDQAVGIRGYNTPLNPRVLVLLDGQQVYLETYGMTLWSAIPVAIDEISRIEIIKGPNAALYGFNAVSGVINIITHNPLKRQQNVASVQGGSQSQSWGDAVGTLGSPGRWAVRLAAQGDRSTEFEGEQGAIWRQQPHSGMVSVDGRVQLAPNLEWDGFGSLSSLESAFFVDIGDYAPVGVRINTVRTGLNWDSAFGAIHLRAYRNEERLSNDFALESNNYRDDLVVASASDLIKTGPHAFRIAAEYRTDDGASFETFHGHIGYQDGSISAMWEWQIGPRVQLTNAVRMDAFFFYHGGQAIDVPDRGVLVQKTQRIEPSFNSGLVIRLNGRNTILLSAARATQLPSLLDYGMQYSAGPILIMGSTALRPSEVSNYEIDWQRALPHLLSRLRVAAFAQHTDVTVGAPFGAGYSVLSNGSLLLAAANFGGSDEVGGELDLRGEAPSGLRWSACYALATIDDHSATRVLQSAPSVIYGRRAPTSAVTLGLGYRWRRLDLDVQSRWQSRSQDFRMQSFSLAVVPVDISNAVTVRVHAAYQVTPRITASLTVDQLTQRQMVTTAGVPTERQIYGGVRVAF